MATQNPYTREAPLQPIPPAITNSALIAQGGYGVFEGLVDKTTRRLLLKEALGLISSAMECYIAESDGEEVRGGRPARRFLHGQGGEYQQAFYESPWLVAFLRDLTATSIVPTGRLATYSYYVRPGDYLAIHRDIMTCDVAVITCLTNGKDAAGEGGSLCLYPDRVNEPLSQIRANPSEGALNVRLNVGQTIVMYGGIVPHALLPVSEEQARIVSVLCYEVAGE